MFEQLNCVYFVHLDIEAQSLVREAGAKSEALPERPVVVIDQSDMYTHVFSHFSDCKQIKYKFMVAVLVEYIKSLNHYQIPVQYYLYELIINLLVNHNCFYQLHQFLQYHVLSDSKPLACLLLSLEGSYAAAHQLALDMLKRLSTATEEIIEVLLSKQHLLAALRFIRSVGAIDTISARKFLDAAKNSQDHMLFYTVFKFFEQRNLRLRGNPKFTQGEHCEPYVKHFEELYGVEAFATSLTV